MSSYHLYFLATSLYGGRELEIIVSPRASVEGRARKFLSPKSSLERESSELFQVPKPIWGGGDYSSKASGKMKKYEGKMKKCEGKMKKYVGRYRKY